ncbi:MAG: hypothetical protein WCW66_02100 [Patescibacteria group bacterium]
MGSEDINYPNAREEGVTPEIEMAREMGLLEPYDETLEWLQSKAAIGLSRNDDMPQPDKTQTPAQESSAAKVRPYEADPGTEIQEMIMERKDILQECGEIEKRIAQSLFGTTLENLPVTPSRIAIAHIGELIQVLEKIDPKVETVAEVRKRVTRLLELARLLKSYMLDVEEETRHFTER